MFETRFEILRTIGLTPAVANQVRALLPAVHEDHRLMRIVEIQRDTFTLHDGENERRARALPRLAHALEASGDTFTVGDWVVVEEDAHGELWFIARLPPVTEIARRANDGRRQTLASNVDTALLTMGLDHDFNPRRMERYIAMVRAAGVEAVVVLTKTDIGTDVYDRLLDLRARLPGAVPILPVNALAPQTCGELAPWLQPGRTLVLLGSSGAGKSTLTNTLTGTLTQDTGGVRLGDGRGRHTTTSRSLHRLSAGACIIDTPGLRTWRPDADAQALAGTFEDIEALAAQCRFRDCRHEGEPGCAVRPHVAPDRLDNWRKLLRDAERGMQTPLDRSAQRARWKVLHKAGAQRAREKRAG